MATCKLERKHYKYVIIGGLVTIAVILMSVFLSGSKKNLGDDAEKSKQVGNETSPSPTISVSTASTTVPPIKGGSETSGTNSDVQTQDKPSNSGGSETSGTNSDVQTQDKPSNSGGSETTETKSDVQTQKPITITEGSCTPKSEGSEIQRSDLLNYVVIEQTDKCSNLAANFYIHNNGVVEKGFGWDKTHGDGKYLSVVIVRSSTETSTGIETVKLLKQLLEEGVAGNKIASGYEIVLSVGLDENLEKEAKELSRYRKIRNGVHPTSASTRRPGKFPVVFAEEWSQEKVESVSQAEPLINEVVVKDGGTRCFDIGSCIESVRKIQGRLDSNFYVAEDGFAYESSGWRSESGKMVVQFLGSYEHRKPSPVAFLALRRLLKLGIWLGDISHDYKLSESSPSKKLVEELKNMGFS